MKVAIAGGTGFVGRALTKKLLNRGDQVVIFTRKNKVSTEKNIEYIQWLQHDQQYGQAINDIDVIINLAGESINSGRWTNKRKQLILNSRIETTTEIVRIIEQMPAKPKALIQASAIGYYGTSTTNTFTEEKQTPGDDFLATTVKLWEQTAQQATDLGVRTVFCRFGIILDKSDGALPRIAFPYHYFIGGKIGNGQQWVSWIHLEDVVRGILFTIDNENIHGAVNFTAPSPVTMNTFGKQLSHVLNRPHWLPVPAFMLKMLLGEMSILVIAGQKVLPHQLEQNGFVFHYPQLEKALSDIYLKEST